jgi:hypothetical protein
MPLPANVVAAAIFLPALASASNNASVASETVRPRRDYLALAVWKSLGSLANFADYSDCTGF